jgi:ribonuclease HII
VTDFSIEKSIEGPVIGLDEVGRGPLAGPVVSCGCLFNSYDRLPENIKITDSKKHTAKQRKKLFLFFKKLQKEKKLQYYLGYASVKEIDTINILEATKLSM